MSSKENSITVVVGTIFFFLATIAVFFAKPVTFRKKHHRKKITKKKRFRHPRKRHRKHDKHLRRKQKKRFATKNRPRKVSAKVKKQWKKALLSYEKNSVLLRLFGDGTSLSYFRQKGKKAKFMEHAKQIKLLYVKGNVLRVIAPHLKIATAAASFNKQIALITTKKELFFLASPKDTTPKRIAKKVGYYPQFSPDNSKLIYLHYAGLDTTKVFEYSIQDQETTMLQKVNAEISSPTFSPDGQEIAYISSESGFASIWKMELQSKEKTQLTNIGLKPGNGIPPGFVSPPQAGKLKWCSQWIVFDTGEFLWSLHNEDNKIKKLAPSPIHFQCLENKAAVGIIKKNSLRVKIKLQ